MMTVTSDIENSKH